MIDGTWLILLFGLVPPWFVRRHRALLRAPHVLVIPGAQTRRRAVLVMAIVSLIPTCIAAVLIAHTLITADVARRADDLSAYGFAFMVASLMTYTFVAAVRSDSLAVGLSERGIAYAGWLIPWHAIRVLEVKKDRLEAKIEARGFWTRVASVFMQRVTITTRSHDLGGLHLVEELERMRCGAG